MAFWTEQTNEPKRNYRFRVELTSFGGGGPTTIIWYAKTFKPPSYTVTEVTHDYLDNKFYYPGRVTWEDCSMQLVDPVSPNAVENTNQVLVNAGYKIKDSGQATPQTLSKNGMTANLGQVVVTILNAAGDEIEKWELERAWIKGVTFSDLDYTNDELRTIDITFRYDWAVCTNKGGANPTAEQFKAGS